MERVEARIKRLEQEARALTLAQPFFDGQLNISAELNSFQLRAVRRDFLYQFEGDFRLENPSKKLPFCQILPIIYLNGNLQRNAGYYNIKILHRNTALYEQGSSVSWHFEGSASGQSFKNGDILTVRPQIVTTDSLKGAKISGNLRWI